MTNVFPGDAFDSDLADDSFNEGHILQFKNEIRYNFLCTSLYVHWMYLIKIMNWCKKKQLAII